MTNHISDELPRMLTGEATRDVVIAAAEHLRTCPDCQQDLVSAVVAHASLTSAHRFAPEIVAPQSGEDRSIGDEPEAVPALPPMTQMFDQIRQEAEQGRHRSERAPRRRRLLAVAAAAVILGGGGVTLAETVGSSSSHQQATQSFSLSAFDRGHEAATVQVIGDRRVSIDASKLPRLGPSQVYELWLTDGIRSRMQPVGVLGNDNKADFTVSPKSLSQYDNFEVSVQATNQTRYSGVSVLRGSYS